jgi:hypothetical protein
MKNLIRIGLVIAFPLFMACEGHVPASEEYIDSSNVTPNSTVNPPDHTSTVMDTTLKTDSPASVGTGVRTDTSARGSDTGRNQ